MTFQAKPKICSFCGLSKRLWKAHPPTCQDCNGRNKQAALDGEPVPRPALKAKPKPTVNGKPSYVALYMACFGYGDTDFIPSELSGDRAVDVHHIKAGNDRQDRIENLMGLTRGEHTEYGDKTQHMAMLFRRHKKFMQDNGVRFDEEWINQKITAYSID